MEQRDPRSRSLLRSRHAATLLLITAAYFVTGRLGMLLSFGAEPITAVWAPSGISLSALLLCGRRVWPAITAGALLVNLTVGGETTPAVGFIVAGNTLEGLIGASLLRRVDFRPSLLRIKDVFALFGLGALPGSAVAGLIGATSLSVFKPALHPWSELVSSWVLWWVGDAVGILLVAPVVLTLLTPTRREMWEGGVIERLAVFAMLAALSFAFLSSRWFLASPHHQLKHIVLPFVLWAGLRLGQRHAALATLCVSSIAICGVARGMGPFMSGNPNERLLMLEGFLSVIALNGLVAGAVTAELWMAERAREAHLAKEQVARAEAERRRAEIEALLDVMPAAVLIAHDRGGTRMTGNRDFHDLFRLAPGADIAQVVREEAVRARIRIFQDGRELAVEERPLERVLARGVDLRNLNLQVRFRDGTAVDVWGHATPIRDAAGALRGAVATFLDVTLLKRTERALRRAEDKFHVAVESAPNAMLLVDGEGHIVLCNARTETIFGYPRAELIGQSVEILVPERFRATHLKHRARLAEDLLTRPMGPHRELCGRRRDGTEVPLEIGLNPVEAAEGMMVLAAVVDISERKQVERTLKEEARRKDELLAMLAHELRNPLAPLRTAAQLLRAGRTDPHGPLDIIDRQIAHLVRLVDDLLDVSRISHGKVLLQPRRVDLVELARASAEEHLPAFGAGKLTFEMKLPRSPLWMNGDPIRLTQVFGSLLDNAAKFTPPGGRVTLEMAEDPARNGTFLWVRDTGVGMGRELIHRAFEPFVQADWSLDRSQGGLGLGLPLAKGLVELHGGRISAASTGSGRGTVFEVWLPLTEPPGPAEGRPADPAHCAGPVKVLIVEDNEDAAESLQLFLQEEGHDAIVAPDGPTGLDIARSFRPDVIFCDIGLPGMSGYEFAVSYRHDSTMQPTYLVALTGYATREDKRRAAEAGFDLHLTKPANLDRLEEILHDVAARRTRASQS